MNFRVFTLPTGSPVAIPVDEVRLAAADPNHAEHTIIVFRSPSAGVSLVSSEDDPLGLYGPALYVIEDFKTVVSRLNTVAN